MTFHLVTTTRARRDFRSLRDFIAGKSPRGANAWANAYFAAVRSLKHNPHRSLAPESQDHPEEIRQVVFKTRSGLSYRALFIIRGEDVHVLHVRGPGQDVMSPEEIELPR
jgi:plasmid stabilization system protein ParE